MEECNIQPIEDSAVVRERVALDGIGQTMVVAGRRRSGRMSGRNVGGLAAAVGLRGVSDTGMHRAGSCLTYGQSWRTGSDKRGPASEEAASERNSATRGMLREPIMVKIEVW